MAAPSGKRALITGASAGLGREFARLFASDGHTPILAARRRSRLEELAGELSESHGVRAEMIPCDLGEPGSAAELASAAQAGGDVDFLINNAGFGSTGSFAELPLERELQMIQVNITALVQLTGLILPEMLRRERGKILNIGSTAGFQAGPHMATYYASKSFVNHFSEALWHESRDTGVTVTVSCPGATETEFSEQAGNDESKLFAGSTASPADVAREAYRAMMDGERMVVHGFGNKLNLQMLRLAPRRTVHRMVYRLNRPA